jgi:AraC family transcriptional regulator
MAMHRVITGPTVAESGDAAGLLLRRVGLPSSVLTSTRYAPRLRLTEHAHTNGFVLFVRDGSFVEHYGRRSDGLDRWTCMYRPPLDEHANEFGPAGATLSAIDVSASWMERLRAAGFRDERFTVRSPFVQQFADRLEAEILMPDSMSDMVIEALATEVLVFGFRAALRRDEPHSSSSARQARRIIEHEFASPLSLARIAAEVGVHPVHLARQFRAAHGCAIGEYIRIVRVAFARHRLTTSDHPIAEIALDAGFADQSQLTKSFKRITGETPAAYRSRRRGR